MRVVTSRRPCTPPRRRGSGRLDGKRFQIVEPRQWLARAVQSEFVKFSRAPLQFAHPSKNSEKRKARWRSRSVRRLLSRPRGASAPLRVELAARPRKQSAAGNSPITQIAKLCPLLSKTQTLKGLPNPVVRSQPHLPATARPIPSTAATSFVLLAQWIVGCVRQIPARIPPCRPAARCGLGAAPLVKTHR